jgi:hypothetical protein
MEDPLLSLRALKYDAKQTSSDAGACNHTDSAGNKLYSVLHSHCLLHKTRYTHNQPNQTVLM